MTDIEEELTPAYRAKKLRAAMDALYDDADPATSLTDLLADARHFADAHGLDFGEHDRVAQGHYCAEITEPSPEPTPTLTLD